MFFLGVSKHIRCTFPQLVKRFQVTFSTEWPLTIHPEVKSALVSGRPVLALETTILTHGMPYPNNLQTAVLVEDIVRAHNVVPATIGVLHGQVVVGLSRSELEELGNPSNVSRLKVSRRDLAYAISQGLSGGTTVSGTMVCAHKAGIPLFVTGGLGGVHRGGEHSLDVSADLTELGKTPVTVVCAGVKSILDIGRTLEYLETQGVTVASYGEERDFPAFFSPKSGFEAPYCVNSPRDAAKLIDSNLTFRVGSGVVIGVPIPSDAHDLGDTIEEGTQTALAEAEDKGITGKALTPFLLERVNQLTGGQSLKANIELIKNNAVVGSQIAVELAKIRNKGTTRQRKRKGSDYKGQPVVIGASIVDSTAKVTSPVIMKEGTNPGSLVQTFGGVGRNIAECMARLDTPPFFISSLGRDANGETLSQHLTQLGISLEGVYKCAEYSTASYFVVLDHRGEMYCGVGDMSINECITIDWVRQFSKQLREAPIVCMDGNLPLETLKFVCNLCSEARVPVWYEPTCVDKAVKVVATDCLSKITYSSPNLSELRSMYSALTGKSTSQKISSELNLSEKLGECMDLVPPLLAHTPNLLISLGQHGVLSCSMEGYSHYPSAADHLLPVGVVSVTGAGDSFVGTAALCLIRGLSHDLSVKAGLRAAYQSLQSHHAVCPQLTIKSFTEKSILQWAPSKPFTVQQHMT